MRGECVCNEKFRTAEDCRDHLPCGEPELPYPLATMYLLAELRNDHYVRYTVVQNTNWIAQGRPVNAEAIQRRAMEYLNGA